MWFEQNCIREKKLYSIHNFQKSSERLDGTNIMVGCCNWKRRGFKIGYSSFFVTYKSWKFGS